MAAALGVLAAGSSAAADRDALDFEHDVSDIEVKDYAVRLTHSRHLIAQSSVSAFLRGGPSRGVQQRRCLNCAAIGQVQTLREAPFGLAACIHSALPSPDI